MILWLETKQRSSFKNMIQNTEFRLKLNHHFNIQTNSHNESENNSLRGTAVCRARVRLIINLKSGYNKLLVDRTTEYLIYHKTTLKLWFGVCHVDSLNYSSYSLDSGHQYVVLIKSQSRISHGLSYFWHLYDCDQQSAIFRILVAV